MTELLDSMGWSGDRDVATGAHDMVDSHDTVDVGYPAHADETEHRLPQTMADFPVAGPGQRLVGAIAGYAVAATSTVTDLGSAPFLILVVGGVGPYLPILYRADRRSLYDLAAGTMVINRSPGAVTPVIRNSPLVTGR